MPKRCGKTAYELVREACYVLGRDCRPFHYSEVIDYIRRHHPECAHKDSTIRLHLKGLSKNVESSRRHHPSLYKRAFLHYLGKGYFKLAKCVELGGREIVRESAAERADIGALDPEDVAKRVMERHLGVKLEKRKLNILGKYKEFDLVNVECSIVGDVKCFKFKGSAPSAAFSNISECVWLMEKLEQSTGKRWRKMIVGMGNRETFVKYAKRYGPWLGDLEIYFIDVESKRLEVIRKPDLGI